MRAEFGLGLLLWTTMTTAAGPAPAQSLTDTGVAVDQTLSSLFAGLPVGEPIAITAFCIAAGTLLLRLTKWLGLLLTVATFGFLGVVLLLAYEPGALTRIVEAVTRI